MKKVPADIVSAQLERFGLTLNELHELADRMLVYEGHPLLVVGRVLFYAPVTPHQRPELDAGVVPRRDGSPPRRR